MELNDYILKMAIASGICEPWAEKITEAIGVDDLLKMYLKGIDFCLDKDFPSRYDLVRLGGDRLQEYGIFVDEQLTVKNSAFTVLLGKCEAELRYSGFSVGQVFIKHNSKTELMLSDKAFVVLDCFDSTIVNVKASDQAKVLVNVYGNAEISSSSVGQGVIKIVHKNKSIY